MFLSHRIRLDPTPSQRDYFARAAGTAGASGTGPWPNGTARWAPD